MQINLNDFIKIITEWEENNKVLKNVNSWEIWVHKNSEYKLCKFSVTEVLSKEKALKNHLWFFFMMIFNRQKLTTDICNAILNFEKRNKETDKIPS